MTNKKFIGFIIALIIVIAIISIVFISAKNTKFDNTDKPINTEKDDKTTIPTKTSSKEDKSIFPLPKGKPMISAGDGFSLALKSNGSVWAWGDNYYGKLGIGSVEDSCMPVKVPTLSDIVSVSAGGHHSLALKSDGSVWAWGENFRGQLGIGSAEDSYIPVQVSTLSDIVSVSAGNNYSLALKSDGSVWAWGDNSRDQLGIGSNDKYINVPVQVYTLSDIVSVSAGNGHSLALKSNGSIWAWGENYNGELGINSDDNYINVPVQVYTLSDIVSVSAGSDYSLILKSDGSVWAWGLNYHGQLGIGSNNNSNVPVQVSALSDIVSVSTETHHSLALKSDGSVWAWGDNYNGELSASSDDNYINVPVQASALSDVIYVDDGWLHSLALKSDGSVWAWGDNYNGKLGISSDYNSDNNYVNVPVQINDFNLYEN